MPQVYSREFLLSLQSAFTERPSDFQNIEGLSNEAKGDRDSMRSSQGRGGFRSQPGRVG
jgi:hypothetical protein